jgi:hypothetical protein
MGRLREAILTGELVDLRSGNASVDDPAHGAGWGAERIVSAEILTELLTKPADSSRRPRALRLAGAVITGSLDLEAVELPCPLLLRGCWFEQPLNIAEAHAPVLRLPGCNMPGLYADQLTTKGNLELNDGFIVSGEVRLAGAHIGGRLTFTAATLINPDGLALSAGRLAVDQSMFALMGLPSGARFSWVAHTLVGDLASAGRH